MKLQLFWLMLVFVLNTGCKNKFTTTPASAVQMMQSHKRGPKDRLYLAAIDSNKTLPFGPERIGNDILVGVGCRNEPENPDTLVQVPTKFGSAQTKTVKLRDRIYLHEFLNTLGGGRCEIVFGDEFERLKIPAHEPPRGDSTSLNFVTFSQVAGFFTWSYYTLEQSGYLLRAAPGAGQSRVLLRNADKMQTVGNKILQVLYGPKIGPQMHFTAPKFFLYLFATVSYWGTLGWAGGNEIQKFSTNENQNALWQFMAQAWAFSQKEFAGSAQEKRYIQLTDRYERDGNTLAARQAVAIRNLMLVQVANRHIDTHFPTKLFGFLGNDFLTSIKGIAEIPVTGINDNFRPASPPPP